MDRCEEGHFRVTDLDKRSETRSGTMACTRKRGSLVGRWLLAHLATLHPSSPSQGMFLRSEYLGSARTLSFPRTAVESCYMDTYARRHDPHTTNAVRARATIHSHVHAGQITTDTDIGSSRTYEEETRDAWLLLALDDTIHERGYPSIRIFPSSAGEAERDRL